MPDNQNDDWIPSYQPGEYPDTIETIKTRDKSKRELERDS